MLHINAETKTNKSSEIAANVMIHEEGRVQIIDFGVATILERKDDKRMSVIGTPHWMGPEALAPTEEGYGTEVSV